MAQPSTGPRSLNPGRKALATCHVAVTRTFPEAGGLISYGASPPAIYRRSGVLRRSASCEGAQPRDLPIEQPTTFELVINLRTAKALGLAIGLSLLGRG